MSPPLRRAAPVAPYRPCLSHAPRLGAKKTTTPKETPEPTHADRRRTTAPASHGRAGPAPVLYRARSTIARPRPRSAPKAAACQALVSRSAHTEPQANDQHAPEKEKSAARSTAAAPWCVAAPEHARAARDSSANRRGLHAASRGRAGPTTAQC